MSKLTPVRKDIDRPHKNKRYSASLRLWHWLNALVITGSLLTVLVNSVVLKRPANPQARAVVHDLREQVWAWHTYIGYALATLLLFRLVLEFFELADQKLIHKIQKAYRQYFITKRQRELAGHEFWVKSIYAVFYILLLITVATGLDLAFEDRVPALKPFHFLKEIHEVNMYLILAFIIIHVAGVYLAERRRTDKGIVSDMIGGGDI